MKNFRELVESPVGKVGRTSEYEAMEHIENTTVGKDFSKMVKKIGGKTIAMKILAMLDSKGNFRTDIPKKAEINDTPFLG